MTKNTAYMSLKSSFLAVKIKNRRKLRRELGKEMFVFNVFCGAGC